jgi:hypothetical protein
MYKGKRIEIMGDLARGWMNNPSDCLCLIHSDTTNGSTTIVDSGEGETTPVVAGNTQHNNDEQKFGATSIRFDGAGSYIDLAENAGAFDTGTDDFTIDFWFYYGSGTEGGFFGKRNDGSDYVSWHFVDSGDATFHYSFGGDQIVLAATLGISTGSWYHIALCRVANTFTTYVNGISVASDISAVELDYSNISGNLTIGETKDNSNTYSTNGYIDEFRFVNDKAMFTTNFIPPRGPYV